MSALDLNPRFPWYEVQSFKDGGTLVDLLSNLLLPQLFCLRPSLRFAVVESAFEPSGLSPYKN